jgi:hypothetical protein
MKIGFTGALLCMLVWSSTVQAECRLTWDVVSGEITGYRVYVSPDLQTVKDREVVGIETTEAQVLCATASFDLGDYAAVSVYDDSGNESPLSNVVQRKNLVSPTNLKVRHFIEVTE